MLKAGDNEPLRIKLLTPEEGIVYERPWPVWTPFVIMGAGLAVAAGGGLLHLRARDSFHGFDAMMLECPVGCVPEPHVRDLLSRGNTLQGVAIGSYAAGGAAVVAGAMLIYLNRPQPRRLGVDGNENRVSVAPLLGNGMGGAMATFHF